ncbi:UNVERIFIED_CONTAM: hypothetical protein B566_EDAN019138 [Ephemera danica]|nr:hypothetical protein B566_EDAN019138 [Ephemera danica]
MGIVPILDQMGFTFTDLLPTDTQVVPFVNDSVEGGPHELHPVTLATVGVASELSAAQITCFSQARDLSHLTPQQQHQLEQTLLKYRDTITDQRIGFTDGVKMDPDRVEAIQKYPTPRDIKQLMRFLGVVSWYAQFVPAGESTVNTPGLQVGSHKPDPWMLKRPDIMQLEQMGDESIQKIVQNLESFSEKYIIKDNILHAHTNNGLLPVLPQRLRPLFLHMCHDDALSGHMGIYKTRKRLERLVYWPTMALDIQHYIKSCERCQLTKPIYRKPAGHIVQPKPTKRWQFVALDYVGPMVRTKKGNRVILVLTDVYTKWVELFPLRDATAELLVKTMRDQVLTRYGAFCFVISDNGPQFTSHLFAQLMYDWGIKHIFCSKYHPQSNQTERTNRNLKSILQAYCVGRHDMWDTYLSSVRFALNSAVHETTGVSPAELTFGDNIISPFENSFLSNNSGNENFNHKDYHKNLEKGLELIKKQIEPTVEKAKARQARNYNKRRRLVSFKPGDLVYTREHHLSNAADQFSAKLADRWGGPYVVLHVHGGVNLVVGETKNTARQHTVHVCDVRPCVERRPDLRTEVAAPETAAESEGEDEPRHSYDLRRRAQ